ncbi:MAG TPA: ISAs1 family transposase, partial [Gammaproteobacteria bacterium]|nr:ISAs1 family transposase [Gammaproteobacteria bacterium]
DYGHHRIEDREYTILPMMYFFKHKNNWRDLSAIIRVRSSRDFLDKTKEKEESIRYYITSLPFKKQEKMIEAIRTHWMIENGLHYKLDVGLHEDDCQIYRGYADQNLAAMRKLVLALLEKEKTFKGGIALKRYEASLSTRYLKKVINL